jgi:hypothetical protein
MIQRLVVRYNCFDFQSLQLLDIDDGDELEFHYSDDRPVKTVPSSKTGDSGVATKVYSDSNVIRL